MTEMLTPELAAENAALAARVRDLEARNARLGARNAELSRARDEAARFMAGLSHELRTPLNSVIGFTELLLDGRTGPLSVEQREQLEVVLESAGHMLGLIAEVLDLERIEAGRLALEPEPVDPVALSGECLRLLAPLAETARVRLELGAEPLGPVALDPRRLRQVLLNYVGNAIKFSPPGGVVALALRAEEGWLGLEVSDEGPGVAVDEAESAFAEFVQLDGRNRGGTGLGLAITKRIVEAQGGSVGVRARPEGGSIFFARLPLVEAEPAQSGLPAGARP